MNKIAKWMTAALMSGVCGSALAQVTYSYQGSDFTTVSGLYTTTDSVSGSFQLSSALAANLSSSLIAPTSFSFSDGVDTITNTMATVGTGIVVSTNSQGQITGWAVNIYDLTESRLENIFSASGTNPPVDYGSYEGSMITVGPVVFGEGLVSYAAGTWSAPTAAPEINPASAASGLTLLVGGLAVLRGRRPQRLTA